MPEVILVLVVLVGATVLMLRRGTDHRDSHTRGWVVRLASLAMVVAVARAAIWYSHSYASHAQITYVKDRVPAASHEHGYASSAACQSCHPGQFTTWHATYHRTMTQTAAPEAVIGDYNDHRVSYGGIDYLLFRRGNGYWARMTPQSSAAAGASQELQLVMTTGMHHYQVYWFNEGPKRSLTEFPLAWLVADQRWIPREAALVMPPHLKQQAVLWNGICIRCHTTHSQPRLDQGSQLADTTAAELGISCEACHGPAEAHIQANQDPSRRYRQHLAKQADETIINPARLPADRSSQVCGQCHAIASFSRQDWWRGHWNAFQPGADLHTTRNVIQPTQENTLVDLREALKANPDYLIGHYWRDGMVRVSGREYNGLIESPCYQGGKFSCLSCHSMHTSDPNDQLAAGMLSDQACLQCHKDFQDRVAEHSHHAADSAGSRCYNCHMPHTTYGLLKAIRSHQISSPSVKASLETGRPNACNQCHLDKSLGWTQEHMANWYGAAKVEMDADQEKLSALATLLLRGDAGQRALAAWSMGWEDAHAASGAKWQVPFLAQLLDDPYPAVRYIAVRSLRRLPGQDKLEYDFVGSAQQRQEVQLRVMAAWEESREGRLDQTGEAILIDTHGALDRDVFERLLKQRDDRDIDLKE